MTTTDKIQKHFKKLNLKRCPSLIFDNRWHKFSEWGLSQYGRYSYRLNPKHGVGQIKGVKGGAISFNWNEKPPLQQILKGACRYEY